MTVSVTSLGMACPLGLRAAPACAAIRAGLNRREELPYADEDGEPIAGSMLDRIPAHLPRRRRWLALAGCALVDLLGQQTLQALAHLPIVIAVSEPEAATPRGAARLHRDLCDELEVELDASSIQVVSGGASAGLRAVAVARTLLEHRPAAACIVLAADSLVDAATLLYYSERRRLLAERNPDGFTPGEAAACLLLQAPTRRSWGSILGIGTGREPALLDNELPMRASGILDASVAALTEAKLAAHELDFRVSDAAGESYHFKEQALLPARLLRQRKQDFPLWLPAKQLGNVGAAASLCGVVIALTAFARGYAPGPRALVCAGSDDGERMAVVLEAPR